MELKELSSNWKHLQKTLPREKDFTKRKAAPESTASRNKCAKRVRRPSEDGILQSARRKLMMGFGTSSLSTTEDEINEALANVDGLDQSRNQSLHDATSDVINAGLSHDTNIGKFLAIDCEMVGVGPQPEHNSVLARVSVVDFHGVQLYDSFVLPKEPVTDYRTFVSGITPKLLRQGRTFEEVQQEVAGLMKGRILVGHHLRHDLDALMMGHPRRDVRDTSKYPPYRAITGGKPPALRRLAKDLLELEIQSGEHSSLEDARATMALFRRDKAGFEQEHAKIWGSSKVSSRYGKAEKEDSIVMKDETRIGSGKKKKKKKKNGKK